MSIIFCIQPTSTSLPGLPEQADEAQARFTPLVHLKYYSKEIPKAKTLPISRVVSIFVSRHSLQLLLKRVL